MTTAKFSAASQDAVLTAKAGQFAPKVSQVAAFVAYGVPPAKYAEVSHDAILFAYAPPAAKFSDASQAAELYGWSGSGPGGNNVVAKASQAAILYAYKTSTPSLPRQQAWEFDLDGHKFYVLPLGPEGDWAYDMSTKQWTQLQTQGFYGLNFTHGMMWGLRIMGGDALYNVLHEMDPNQPLDMGYNPVQHVVTGAISTRGRNMIGCASFTITASPNDIQQAGSIISLSFSDDNGETWVGPFNQTLTGKANQLLTWSALGSFAIPGRIFQVSDQAGVVRIDGADAALQNYNEDDEKGT